MKKYWLLVLSIAWMMVPVAQAQTVYMTDGFENGFAPTCDASCKTKAWTQEYYDRAQGVWVTNAPKDSQPWKTETGSSLKYPDGPAMGNGRAYFRNEPGGAGNVQTAGYKTRLVTPVLDLSKGYQPILRFYHAQDKYTGDFDTLRVYYRTGAGMEWILIEEYTSYIKKWTFEEISLPAVGENYQIAFEANENIGRGIVLDSVLVRTRPQITTPHDVAFTDMHDNGMTIQWQASMDADYFQMVVTKKADLDLNVNPEYLDSASVIIVDSIVDSDVQQIRVDSLEGGATYYVQIRSIGETENSVWCAPVSIRLKATEYVPYFEDFNIKYKSNAVKDMQLETWYWGGDYEPVIPMWIGEEYFKNYSPDATPAVAFIAEKLSSSGEFSGATTFIPAGKTSYLVSPELASKEAGFALNQCHVTFWGTVRHATDENIKSIIVGVATDPTDASTFVPVDTCTIWGYETFEFVDVDLASYTGEGRYVFFAVNFDKSNQFYIDKVTIEKRPQVGQVKMQSIKCIPDTSSFALSWDAVVGATKYYVKYSKMESKGSVLPLFAKDMDNITTMEATTNSIQLTELNPCSKYMVSIQANGGEWSQPKAFYTSAVMSVPATYSFEGDEGTYYIGTDASTVYPKDWLVFSNDPDLPYCYNSTTYSHSGNYSLYLVMNVGNDAWVVAPWVDTVQNMEVKFYDKTSSTYVGSKLQIGVMTDPTDLNTFVAVNEITISDKTQSYYSNFVTYKGNGHYIAFRWVGNITATVKCTHAIDDVMIRPLGSCLPLNNLAVNQVTDSSAVITWAQSDADKYRLIVNSSSISENDLLTAKGDVLDTMVTGSSYSLSALGWARPYYVYACGICGVDQSEWTSTMFKTECPALVKVPYFESFEYCETGSSKCPNCWTPALVATTTIYPYVTTTYPVTGSNCLYMYSYTTYGSVVALPEMDRPLNTLKVKFYAKGSSSGYTITVGVLTDPADADTFEPITTFATSTDYVEYVAALSSYTGKGKYIALSTFTGASNIVYVDDVTVEDMTDDAPTSYKVVNATTSSLSATWDGITTGQWQLVVSKKYYEIGKDFDISVIPSTDRIAEASLDTNYYAIASGLEPLTKYYFYVKSSNGTKWSVGELSTACTTWNPREKYTEGFEAYGPTCTYTLSSTASYKIAPNWWEKAITPTCWTVGNQKLGTDPSVCTSTTRSYMPFIFSNGSVTVSGTTVTTSNYYDKGTALTTAKYAPAGCNALKMYTSTTYGIVWAAMPELECSDEDLSSLVITAQARFTAATASIPHSLIVGVMDDPTDLSTFVVLDSFATGAGTASSSAVQNIEVSIGDKGYTGHGRYIAFRTAYNPGAAASAAYKVCATTVYLDNVSIALASCAAPSISFAQVTDTTARLYSGLKIDNAWKYYIGYKPFNTTAMDEGTMPADSVVLETKVVGDGFVPVPYYTLKGLKPDTTYYVAVATVCGESTSAWKQSSFKTMCSDVDIATFFEGFEDYEVGTGKSVGCWTIGNIAAPSNTTYIPYAIASTLTGSKKVLNIYSYKSTANGAYAITPGLAFEQGKSLKDYQLHCKVLASTSATSISTAATTEFRMLIGVTTDPSNMSSVVILDTVIFNKGVNTFVYPFDQYTGDGKYVVFMGIADLQNYSRVYVDDVEFEPIPACQAPYKLAISEVGSEEMTLSWTGNAANYLVALSTELYVDSVKEDSIASSKKVIKAEVQGNSYKFVGLKGNTMYYAYVQAICSASEKSVWSYDVCAAKTDCPDRESLPYFTNFDDNSATGAGKRPDCWLGAYYTYTTGVYNKASYPYVLATASKALGGTGYCLEMMSSSTYVNYVVAPEVKGDLNELAVSFYATNYSVAAGRHVHIGYVTDWSSDTAIVNTFKLLGSVELPNSNTYNFYIFDMSALDDTIPENVRLTVSADYRLDGLTSGSVDLLIDNFKISTPPTCYVPTNVAVSEIGLTEATLTFEKADSLDTKWQARLKNVATQAEQVLTVTTIPYTMTVEAASQYTVEVRTDCGDSQSDWSDPVTFNTKYTIDTYTFTFDKDEQGTQSIRSPKSTSDSYFIHPALTSETGNNATSYSYFPYQYANTTALSYSIEPTGDVSAAAMRFYTTATYDSATVILPVITNPNGKQLSFYMRSGYAYVSNHTTASYNNVVNTVYSTAAITVGVVDSMKSYQTFQAIQTYKPSTLIKNDTLKAASNYGWSKVVVPLDGINMSGKQIALMMKGCPGTTYMYVDNVAIEAAEGYATPAITKVQALDTTAVLTWTDAKASGYNVYVIDTTKSDKRLNFFPYLQDADSAIVTKYSGITTTSFTVPGLEEKTTYVFYVENNDQAGAFGALSGRCFATTSCTATDGNGYTYGFEPGPGYVKGTNPSTSTPDGFTFQWPTSTTATDTVYKTPDCWTVGLEGYDITSTTYKSYTPTMFSNKMTATTEASKYKYARSGFSAFQFYSTSTYANCAYAVLPLLNLDMDTAELEFYARSTYESQDKIYSISYLKGTTYSTKMSVGTMTDPTDPTTFVALDTVEYDYTSSQLATSMLVTSDQTGNKYFQRFIVPLKGATGKFIAFKQVGYGYFYMDDIAIRKAQTVPAPRNADEVEIGSTTTKVAWKGMMDDGVYTLQYVEATPAQAVDWTNATTVDNITAQEYTLTGLKVNADYAWRVCQAVTDMQTSDYAVYRFFRTECNAINPNGYSTGFECKESDPYTMLNATLKQNECWKYINLGTTQTISTSWAYNIPGSGTTSYAHDGAYALKLYAYGTTFRDVAVTPVIDAEIGQAGKGFDTLQVSFWACPSPHNTNTGKISSASGATYAKTVEVGTCTDPSDTTTYKVLQVCTYEVAGNNLPTTTIANASNDYAFKKFTVKLNEANGPYVFFRACKTMSDGSTKTYSTMYIDDVVFETLQNCEPVIDLRTENITMNSADIKWTENGSASYDILVSSDASLTDTVFYQENLTATTVTVKDLEPGTQYFFTVKNYCDKARKESSDWAQRAYFYTVKTPMFEEQFTSDNIKIESKGWKTCRALAKNVFAGQESVRDTTLSGVYNSWYRVQNNAMSGYALRSYLYYSSTGDAYTQRNWLVTPAITLAENEAKNPVALNFDIALTYFNTTTGQSIQTDTAWNSGWDDQFMVIVSEDAGQTWKQENATIWNNETGLDPDKTIYGKGNYSLTSISNIPSKVSVDLSKYMGKTIKVAFYAENTVQNAKNAVHIDNVHINYTANNTADLTLCQFEDVDDVFGFNINGDTVSTGTVVKQRYNLATEQGDVDSVFVLKAEYLEAPIYNYTITVCEGTPFSYMGFNEHSAPGTYRMKLQSQVTGCDSIVNFTIQHTKQFSTTIDTTICEGEWFMWNDQLINKAGTFTANLNACAKFGACDSTVTMNVQVVNLKRSRTVKSICEGSSVIFGGKEYDKSGVYYDTIATSGCDSIAELQLTVRTNAHVSIVDSIYHGEIYTWGNRSYTETGKYDSTFVDQYGCDSIVTLNLMVSYKAPVFFNDYTCQGYAYEFGGKQLTEAGIYYDTIARYGVADSISGLRLEVKIPNVVNISDSICAGGEYQFGDTVLTTAGYFTKVFKNQFGCDSTINLMLTVNPLKRGSQDVTLCYGETYMFGGIERTQSGVYYDTLATSSCDSIATLNLTIRAKAESSFQASILHGETYTWGNRQFTESTVSDSTFTDIFGCDSIVTLNLTVKYSEINYSNGSICQGDSILWQDKWLSQAGTYIDTIVRPGVADSIVGLILEVKKLSTKDMNASICEGESYAFGDTILAQAGSYTKVFKDQYGCDSTVNLMLTVNPLKRGSINKEICYGDSYEFGGKQLTQSGMYYDTIPAVEGCDSVVTLTLTVRAKAESSFQASIYHGEIYTWGNRQYTETGNYDSIFVDQYGCDSTVTLNLMVSYKAPVFFNDYTCQGSPYIFGGKEYYETGIYYDTIVSYGVADSIAGLRLDVKLPKTINTTASICDGSEYVFGDTTLTTAGSYTKVFPDQYGCDSTVNLTLSVQEASSKQIAEAICQGDSYEFGGKLLTESGVYYDTIPSMMGCDSIITTLTLTVNVPTSGEISKTICHGSYYEFGGQKLSVAGDYVDTIANKAGCDSIVTLHLSVNEPLSGTKYADIVKGCTYTYQGVTYTKPGTYTVDTLRNEQGCDSIITLVLSEAAQGNDTIYATVCPGEYYIDEDFNTNVVGWHETTIITGDCEIIRHLYLSNYKNTFTEEKTICSGETYMWRGQALTEAGVYNTLVPGDPDAPMPCDSVITLTLYVLTGDTTYVNDTISTDELPYMYKGEEILSATTQPGTYNVQKEFSAGTCSETVIFNIVVYQAQGIADVKYNNLVIIPNVIKRDESVVINNSFNAADRATMKIDMYDMLGHLIHVDVPETGDIVLSNFPCAGIFTVRVTTAGETYIGRVVVKN